MAKTSWLKIKFVGCAHVPRLYEILDYLFIRNAYPANPADDVKVVNLILLVKTCYSLTVVSIIICLPSNHEKKKKICCDKRAKSHDF